MSLKTKKIVFSSVALGLSVLSMILFILPIYGGASPYFLVRLLPLLGFNSPTVILGLILCLFSLLFILLTAVMIVLSLLVLLCDVDVIKNDKARKGLKKALVIIGTFQIVFVFMVCAVAIITSIMDGYDIEYAGIITTLLLSLALRIMIRFVGRLEKVNEESKEQAEQTTGSNEETAVESTSTEESKEEKTDKKKKMQAKRINNNLNKFNKK